MARNRAGATDAINFDEDADVVEQLKELTGGRGPDACIDAVGMEAPRPRRRCTPYDRVKQATRMRDRPRRTRCATRSSRAGRGGIVSIIGVYGGLMDKFPIGRADEQGR